MRYDEPNGSYYSARYAERKRAQERAQDAAAGPRPCNRCPTTCAPGSIFCPEHTAEYAELCKTGDIDVCREFCQRTYWPPIPEAPARRRSGARGRRT